MYNQSGLIGNINKDIFKIREYMIKNMMIKHSIDSIKYRAKNNKNSLLKDYKEFQIKKPLPLKQQVPLSKPIKTFLPINKSTKGNSPINNINYNYKNINSSPSILIRPKSLNSSYSKSSTNIKAAVDSGNEKSFRIHRDYKSKFNDAKRRNSVNKDIKIIKQNEEFGKKLKRINSPLNKERLNESYSKLKEYRNILNKNENINENKIKRINHVKNYLPHLICNTPNVNNFVSNNNNNLKSNKMLALGKIKNFKKFDFI
jgi:hypothetical protein